MLDERMKLTSALYRLMPFLSCRDLQKPIQ